MQTSIDFIGPFHDKFYVFSVDGFKVPYITGNVDEHGIWTIFVDHRLGYTFTEAALRDMLPLLANAMAISAGLSCHGSRDRSNPHSVQVHQITHALDYPVIDLTQPGTEQTGS